MRLLLIAFFIGVLTSAQSLHAESKQPNFVFFLVDDMGWADVGCFGSTFHETPNIDSLCESGMKFTHGYAACPVCSPTRASIMTGRHPVRVDITDWIPGRGTSKTAKFLHVNDRKELAHEEITIAEVLKQNGYQTFFAGKWHLGDQGHWPTDQGFDVNIGGNSKGSPPGGYYAPWKNPTLQANSKDEYLTERLTEESISLIKNRDKQKPFLLYLAYYNIHTPITPYKKEIEKYQAKAAKIFQTPTPVIKEHGDVAQSRARQDNAALASMVSAVDHSVGEIIKTLNEQKIDENTVVMFFSDNGGLCTLKRAGPGCNLPLRSGKGWLYEGGIREPTIIKAPGVTKPGSVTSVPLVSTDFFPTILELAGIDQMPQLHADGISQLETLKGSAGSTDRALYWHYPHYHGSAWTPGAAIIEDGWKLIEFYEYETVELYHLRQDPGELNNLSEKKPEKVAYLKKKLATWQQKMGAKMPQPNPDYVQK